MTVPHFTTAQSDPLLGLERRIFDALPSIGRWLRDQWLEIAVPFHAPVDLRNCGFKPAPVDTILFPCGFNNPDREFHPLCVQAAMAAAERAIRT
jgi:glutamate--cysteine ligase